MQVAPIYFIVGFIVILGIFFCLRKVFLFAIVSHNSMLPTFSPGERVLVIRFWPRKWLRKGQVVLVSIEGDNEIYIKRIVALEGESYKNYKHILNVRGEIIRVNCIWKIPKNHFFVVGDNLEYSSDSRDWGAIPFSCFFGLAIHKLPKL